MKLFQSSQDRDLELLSAYLDNELSPSEREKLEHRLATHAHLRRTLVGLRRAQTILTDLPRLKPPRSFILKPKMIGQTRRTPSRLIPMLNYATTIAAILFAVVIGSELATSFQPLAAPALVQDQTVGQTESMQAQSAQAQEGAILKSTTETPSVMIAAQPSCAEGQEPLTGGGCGTGGGEPSVGSTGTAGDSAPLQTFSNLAPTDSTPPAEGFVVAATALTPTPDDTLLRTTDTEPPVALEAPTPSPAETDFYQTATETQSLSPTRLALIVLGGVLTLLLIASVIIRRR